MKKIYRSNASSPFSVSFGCKEDEEPIRNMCTIESSVTSRLNTLTHHMSSNDSYFGVILIRFQNNL